MIRLCLPLAAITLLVTAGCKRESSSDPSPPEKPALARSEPGGACLSDNGCLDGLECWHGICTYYEACSGTVEHLGDVSWMDRLRCRVDESGARLSEVVTYEDSKEKVVHRVRRWIEPERKRMKVDFDGDGTAEYAEDRSYDENGRWTQMQHDGPDGVKITVRATWQDGCSRPNEVTTRNGVEAERLEVRCDDRGRPVEETRKAGDQAIGTRTWEWAADGKSARQTTRREGAPNAQTTSLRFGPHGQLVVQEVDREGDGTIDERRTFEYACWAVRDGKVTGGPTGQLTGLEPGPPLARVAGRWVEDATKDAVEIVLKGRRVQVTVDGKTREGDVLTQTAESARIHTPKGPIELHVYEQGPLQMAAWEGSSGIARALTLRRDR